MLEDIRVQSMQEEGHDGEDRKVLNPGELDHLGGRRGVPIFLFRQNTTQHTRQSTIQHHTTL
jgi:hypothetical protein